MSSQLRADANSSKSEETHRRTYGLSWFEFKFKFLVCLGKQDVKVTQV